MSCSETPFATASARTSRPKRGLQNLVWRTFVAQVVDAQGNLQSVLHRPYRFLKTNAARGGDRPLLLGDIARFEAASEDMVGAIDQDSAKRSARVVESIGSRQQLPFLPACPTRSRGGSRCFGSNVHGA